MTHKDEKHIADSGQGNYHSNLTLVHCDDS